MRTKIKWFLVLSMALMAQISFAQERTVTGTVMDGSGLPLPGVSVTKKGTSAGAQTDIDGKFQIQASPTDVLVFSFIGMSTKELPATSTVMNVTLAEDATELDMVVVTALGIRRDKKALGYSTTLMKSEELTRVVNSNVFESLSGKIAGVDISAPQTAGASAKIIVRGLSSITQPNAPLYIVDGTPINNSASGSTSNTRSFDAGTGISDLDPNSIESINFLKGAAASVLYGSRGSNGVFIITTKKGRNQSKITVDFVSSIETNEVARVPHLQNQFGQGWNGEGYTGSSASNENGSWGPAFNGEIRPWGNIVNNSQQIKPYVGLEDNVKDFYDLGVMTTNSITLRGGGENSDFSLGFTNLSSDGIVPTDADRYVKRTLAFNGGLKSSKFTLRASINYTNKEQNAVNTGQGDDAGEGSTLQQDLLQIPRDISVVDLADYINNPFNTPSNYFTPYATNPYFAINENSTKITGNNLFGNTNLSYLITPELSANWQIGGNYRIESIKSYGAIVDYLPGSPQDVASANPVVGGVTEARIERSEFDTYFNLTYDKDISDKLHLNVLGGIAYNQIQSNTLFNSVTGLDVPNYYELSNSANRPVITQNDLLQRTFGVFGQAELAWNNRYFLTLSARSDKNSTLPAQDNSYFYPAASLSAVVIDDGNNYLKLRGGVAQVANGGNAYLTESSLVAGNAAANFGQILAPIGGVNFYELSGVLGNNELKPEKTTETEFGVEGNLFGNRITFDASVYYSKTQDLIVTLPLDPSTGYLSQAQNVGDLVNKGVEIAFGFTPVENTDFKWNVNYTFSKNLNEVTNLEGTNKVLISSAYGVNFYAVEGQPLGVFQALVAQTTESGQTIVNPDTGYAQVTTEEQTIGDSQRDFVMGLQNTFKYKNLSLSFGLDWKQGGEMYSYTNRLSNFTGNSIESTYNDRSPFIIPNSVVPDPNSPGNYIENTTPVSFANITNYWGNTTNNPAIEQNHVIDKTFVRLRELNFTYSFSSKIIDQLGLSSLSISFYGKNLFLWTPDENPYIDPETTTYGSDILSEFGEFGTNPSQRTYGGVIKLSF